MDQVSLDRVNSISENFAAAVDEEDADGISQEVLALLAPQEITVLRQFVRGVGSSEIDNFHQFFPAIKQKLGVRHEAAVLHRVYGDAEQKWVEIAYADMKLKPTEIKEFTRFLNGQNEYLYLSNFGGISRTEIFAQAHEKIASAKKKFKDVPAEVVNALTPKELEVLVLRIQGKTMDQIATELGNKGPTINEMLKHIHKKLDAHGIEGLCAKHYGEIEYRKLEFLGEEPYRLTPRELDVLSTILTGRNLSRTAGFEGISWNTGVGHLRHIYGKLGIKVGMHRNGHPVLFATVHGLIRAREEQVAEPHFLAAPAQAVDNAGAPAP